jgi:hypothetical protein
LGGGGIATGMAGENPPRPGVAEDSATVNQNRLGGAFGPKFRLLALAFSMLATTGQPLGALRGCKFATETAGAGIPVLWPQRTMPRRRPRHGQLKEPESDARMTRNRSGACNRGRAPAEALNMSHIIQKVVSIIQLQWPVRPCHTREPSSRDGGCSVLLELELAHLAGPGFRLSPPPSRTPGRPRKMYTKIRRLGYLSGWERAALSRCQWRASGSLQVGPPTDQPTRTAASTCYFFFKFKFGSY